MTQAPPTKVCKRCHAEVAGENTTCPYDGWQLEDLPADPWVGKIFNGKYEIGSVLGQGGMSIVYKARDVFMDRVVAIKVLHNHLVSDKTSIQRFRQEAQAAGNLQHPNIITVYDFGLTPEDQAFLIMECFEGPTLAEVLDEQGRIPADRALRILRQICDGLELAHKKGVVHRDLKPSNLCLHKDEDGVEIVKIVDFGIAKLLPQEGKQRQQLTQTGQIFGSPLFMSPEQCQGKPLDARSDLYSLGCLMYEALTGSPPFMGPTAYDTMTMHVNDPVKSLKKTAPEVDIPPDLELPILRLLEKNPDKRYQTAAELKADLPPLPEETLQITKEWTPSWYRSIKHNPAARATVVICLSVVIPLLMFLTLWPGPETDRGTFMQKIIWNFQISQAESAINAGHYGYAKHMLERAEYLAYDHFSDKQKLLDTYMLMCKLGAKVDKDPTGEWQKYTMYAVENMKLTLQERAIDHFQKEREWYQALAKSTDSIERKKEIIESRAGHAELVARELDALRYYLNEEQLLQLALSVDTHVLGENHWRIADLDSQLADCYRHMQHTRPMYDLLENAYKINLHSKARGIDSLDTLDSLLELGQFYRDQSVYNKAEDKLKLSVSMAERLYNKATTDLAEEERKYGQMRSDKLSETADAEQQAKVHKAKQRVKESRILLIEAYNSYGDYFNQLKDIKQSEIYFNKGNALYQQAIKNISDGTISGTPLDVADHHPT